MSEDYRTLPKPTDEWLRSLREFVDNANTGVGSIKTIDRINCIEDENGASYYDTDWTMSNRGGLVNIRHHDTGSIVISTPNNNYNFTPLVARSLAKYFLSLYPHDNSPKDHLIDYYKSIIKAQATKIKYLEEYVKDPLMYGRKSLVDVLTNIKEQKKQLIREQLLQKLKEIDEL